MDRRPTALLFCVLLAAWFAAVAAAQPEPSQAPPPPRVTEQRTLEELKPKRGAETVRVALEISQAGQQWGRIVLELNAGRAPRTVENFLHYVDSGFYDGTIFHRVIPGYLIQAGGYTTQAEPKRAIHRRPVRNESRNGLKNRRGTIAMARMKGPHTATSQFLINLADNTKLDYPGHDGWGYCVFGQVVEGLEVVERIRGVKTRPDASVKVDQSPSRPVDPPVIGRAYRLDGPAAKPPVAGRPPITPVPMGEEPPPDDLEEQEFEEVEPEEEPEPPVPDPEDPNDGSETPG